jgi:hypothetical protein
MEHFFYKPDMIFLVPQKGIGKSSGTKKRFEEKH